MTDPHDLAADLAAVEAALDAAPAYTRGPRFHLSPLAAQQAVALGYLRPEDIATSPPLPARPQPRLIDIEAAIDATLAPTADPQATVAELHALVDRYVEPPPLTVYCEPGQRDTVQAAADEARARVDAARPFLSAPARRVVVAESPLVEPGTVVWVDPAH